MIKNSDRDHVWCASLTDHELTHLFRFRDSYESDQNNDFLSVWQKLRPEILLGIMYDMHFRQTISLHSAFESDIYSLCVAESVRHL